MKGITKVKVGMLTVVIVIIAVLSAAITPTIDPVNMALVMGPMIVLYFLGIFLAKVAERGRPREISESETSPDSVSQTS